MQDKGNAHSTSRSGQTRFLHRQRTGREVTDAEGLTDAEGDTDARGTQTPREVTDARGGHRCRGVTDAEGVTDDEAWQESTSAGRAPRRQARANREGLRGGTRPEASPNRPGSPRPS